MRNQIKRIISEVAQGSAEWANRNKKVIGGVGVAGAVGAVSSDQIADFFRRGASLGKRIAGVGDAVEKAENQEEVQTATLPPVMYGYRFTATPSGGENYHWESLRNKK